MTAPPLISTEIYDRFAALPTANIGDAMDRLCVLGGGIRPVYPKARLVGPAFTVLVPAGDNKAIHDAVATAPAGAVIVVNGQGYRDRALIGELIAGRAIARGIAGFVIDGAIRDVEELETLGFPVYARAVTPAGPYRNGPGLLQRPVAVGGVVVSPGDVIVGDADGVVAVSRDDVEAILKRAEEKQRAESAQRAETPRLYAADN
ncbi:RraA family protein [Micromonospora sp. NPDC005206]|uniref:RraA family protein n=1 Tax=Micromonospora sp. NPDC005206 TaxID=3157022 RepID=UPI0033BE9BF4